MNTENAEFNENAEIQKMMPNSGKIYDFEFGPKERMPDESFQKYKLRRKVEAYILNTRLVRGINTWDASKHGCFTDPGKKQRKTFNKVKKMFLKQKMKEYKQNNYGAKMPLEVIEDIKNSWS